MSDNTKKEKKPFFKGMKSELKKVIWPTSTQVVNNTTAVIVVVLIVISIVVVLDLGLEKIREFGIEKMNTVISSTEQDVVVGEENSTENSTENSPNDSTDGDMTNAPTDENTVD